jgi:hypothetical protein
MTCGYAKILLQWHVVTLSYCYNEMWFNLGIFTMTCGYAEIFLQWRVVTLSYCCHEMWLHWDYFCNDMWLRWVIVTMKCGYTEAWLQWNMVTLTYSYNETWLQQLQWGVITLLYDSSELWLNCRRVTLTDIVARLRATQPRYLGSIPDMTRREFSFQSVQNRSAAQTACDLTSSDSSSSGRKATVSWSSRFTSVCE